MDRFGPSMDCIICGQPESQIAFRHCYSCDTDMCPHCCAHHSCMEVLEKKRELFLEDFKAKFTEFLAEHDYYIDGILLADLVV